MYNIQELLSTYGVLFNEQMFIENKYKKLGELATEKALENSRISGNAGTSKLGNRFVSFGFKYARESIADFVEKSLSRKVGAKPGYVSILSDLALFFEDDKDTLYDILTYSVMSITLSACTRSQTAFLSNTAQAIAVEITDEYNLRRYMERTTQLKGVVNGLDKRVQVSYKRAYAAACMKKENYVFQKWNNGELKKLCTIFIFLVATATDYFEITKGSKGIQSISGTTKLIEAWQKNTQAMISNSYKMCPTVIPPRPWESIEDGGYYGELSHKASLLRLHDVNSVYGRNYISLLNQCELAPVKKAINAIQATPWKINKRVLSVIEALVESGGGRAGIPYMEEAPKPIVLSENPTQEELIRYKQLMPDWYRGETSRKSIALRVLSHLKMAEDFQEYERIYFPCNMDFRGRIYPIPSFNFQGDDVNKALLLFADAPACQSMTDIEWLMVHGANLAGVDKVSFAERKQWIIDHTDDILRSAQDPVGYTWWQTQDEPCQMLAFCFEWQAWKVWEKEHNGDPKGFVSGIPVAFDGTCSGLQHFSAILRDPIGGQAVNLIPADRPSDIYAIVAEKVNKQIDEDLLKGTPDTVEGVKVNYGTKTMAQVWRTYGVTRKVTKRSTMTLAYGSKEYGFKDQLLEDIIKPDMAENTGSVFNQYNCFQAATYMAHLIWEAVKTTVVKAVEGMKWLQTCAKAVTKNGNVVNWVTPLGLPIQQNYMQTTTKVIEIKIAGKHLMLYDTRRTGDIDKRSQASGIAPNFIHSMDAAHLQLTVCNAVDAGIGHFAVIHDSFAAPVAQSDTLFKVVRQSFVQLYTEHDVLKEFRAYMMEYVDKPLPPLPKKGTLDIEEVLNSPYIFC